MSIFPTLGYLREAMNTTKATRIELLFAKWFGRHFHTDVEGIRYGFIDYRGKVYFVSQEPVQEPLKPCPFNCSKAMRCISEEPECPCSDPDRTGTPDHRINKAMAIGYVCGVLFWTLVALYISWSLPL